MSVIRWEDPPPQSRGPKPGRSSLIDDDWAQAVAAELRAHPKQWAVIWKAPTLPEAATVALRITNCHRAFRSFDAASRKAHEGLYLVYARYVGEGDA